MRRSKSLHTGRPGVGAMSHRQTLSMIRMSNGSGFNGRGAATGRLVAAGGGKWFGNPSRVSPGRLLPRRSAKLIMFGKGRGLGACLVYVQPSQHRCVPRFRPRSHSAHRGLIRGGSGATSRWGRGVATRQSAASAATGRRSGGAPNPCGWRLSPPAVWGLQTALPASFRCPSACWNERLQRAQPLPLRRRIGSGRWCDVAPSRVTPPGGRRCGREVSSERSADRHPGLPLARARRRWP